MIYFIQEGGEGNIKIGKAKDVIKRLKQLQGNNGNDLWLLGHCDDSWNEKKLHEKFKDFRIRGEWFRFNTNILDFIREHANTYLVDKAKRFFCYSVGSYHIDGSSLVQDSLKYACYYVEQSVILEAHCIYDLGITGGTRGNLFETNSFAEAKQFVIKGVLSEVKEDLKKNSQKGLQEYKMKLEAEVEELENFLKKQDILAKKKFLKDDLYQKIRPRIKL